MIPDPQHPAVPHPPCISAELRLAIEILMLNQNGTLATFTVLKERLASEMDRNTVSNALDKVGGWGIAEGHYGPLGDGRAGYCYTITEPAEPFVNDLMARFQAGKVIYVLEVVS